MKGELTFASPSDAADAAAFLGRAVRLDARALVRLRGGGVVRLWCWLPMDVLATRTVAAALAPGDVTVSAAALRDALPADATHAAPLPPARDADWRGALPPPHAGELLDTIPADVVTGLLSAAERAFREASATADPQAVGDALLDQDVLTVSSGAASAGVPLKGLLALARMGFFGAGRAGAGRPMEVALAGSWLRLSSNYGDAYLRRGDRLGLFPATRG